MRARIQGQTAPPPLRGAAPFESQLGDSDQAMIDLAWTEAMRIDLVKAWAAWVMFCVACGCTLGMYWKFLPHTAALLWSSWVALFLLVWAGWNVQFGFQPPDTANLRKIWWPRTQAIVLMSNAIVVATVWLFLPNGGRDEMLMMLVFYMAMIPTQILTSPENSASIRLGTAALFGSILLYLIQHPTQLRDPLLVFVSVYGAVMFSFSSAQGELVKKAVQSDVKNRKLVHQLDKSIESLRLAQASKTQFIETASHDLLQPLQASRLYLNAVLHAPQVIQRELAAQGMQRAITSVETQLAHMIQGLHLHGEDGLELSSELLDIGEVMTHVAEQFHLSAREKKDRHHGPPFALEGVAGPDSAAPSVVQHGGQRHQAQSCPSHSCSLQKNSRRTPAHLDSGRRGGHSRSRSALDFRQPLPRRGHSNDTSQWIWFGPGFRAAHGETARGHGGLGTALDQRRCVLHGTAGPPGE